MSRREDVLSSAVFRARCHCDEVYGAYKAAERASRVTALTSRVGEISQKLAKLLAARVRLFASEAQGAIPAFSRTEAASTREAAWEKYLARKQADGKPPLSRDQWDRKYDTLNANKLQGEDFQLAEMEVQGIKAGQDGWVREYADPAIPGRRWDAANPDQQIAQEYKSGSAPEKESLDQMAKDEQAVKSGWKVEWILKDQLNPTQMANLQRLAQQYPGEFTYRIVGGTK